MYLRGLGSRCIICTCHWCTRQEPFKQFEVDDLVHMVLSKLGSNTLHGRIKYGFIGCIHDRFLLDV